MSTYEYSNNQNITDHKTFNMKSLKSSLIRNYDLLDNFSPSPLNILFISAWCWKGML